MTYPALLGTNPSTYGPPAGVPMHATGYGMPTPGATLNPNAPSYKKGGGIKRGKLVAVHISHPEVDGMDFLQGKIERDPRTGMRSYTHMEELLKNPHFLTQVYRHAHAHHAAHGGHMGPINPHAGMHGDTETVLIGPHTQRVFDHLARSMGVPEHELRNPVDGHPQYFSLGSILGGIGSALGGALPSIGNAVKGALPSLGGLASKAAGAVSNALPSLGGLASKAGSALSGAAGSLGGLANQGMQMAKDMGPQGFSDLANMAGQIKNGMGADAQNMQSGNNFMDTLKNFGNSELGQSLKNKALGMGKDFISNKLQESQNPYIQTLGQGINAAGNAYLGGQSPREALGQGISAAGQNFGGGIGGAIQNLGQGIGTGSSPGQIMRNTAHGAYEGMGGMGGLQNMGMQAFNNFRSGQGIPSSFANMMQQHLQQNLPRRQTPNYIPMHDMPFADYGYE